MVPAGATHVQLKGTAKLCRKLGIEYAEACTGFEFGNRRAVPVLTGVVVAEENRQMVIDAWREDERIKKEKEDGKREQRALTLWKKFLHGLKVVKRMKETYGVGDDLPDDVNPFMRKQNNITEERSEEAPASKDGDTGSGFLLEHVDSAEDVGGGGFLLPGDGDESELEGRGGFIVEGEVEKLINKSAIAKVTKNGKSYPGTPISLQSLHKETISMEADRLTPMDEDEPEAGKSPLNPPEEDPKDESDAVLIKSKRGAPRSRATCGRKARRGSNARPRRAAIIDEDEDEAASESEKSSISSPNEDLEDESDNFAPIKPKRGTARSRGTRGGKARSSSSTRPSRSAATSSPYFKRQK
jgi:xeroderma pigmentosum group C-complementing protein